MLQKFKFSTVLLLISFLVISITGCIRTHTYQKDRVDQSLSGNQGYISGTPAVLKESPEPLKRSILGIEVELPPYPEWYKKTSEDKEIWGNRGYIIEQGEITKQRVGTGLKPVLTPVDRTVDSKVRKSTPSMREFESQKTEPTPLPPARYIKYVVKEDQTLQDISKEVYGTTKGWMRIFDANRDKLKHPDKIYPGQELIVPRGK